jgi:hypothetical protein
MVAAASSIIGAGLGAKLICSGPSMLHPQKKYLLDLRKSNPFVTISTKAQFIKRLIGKD